MTLIDTTVIKGDIEDLNGDVLQVLAAAPGQTALKWSIQRHWCIILVLVYLGQSKQIYIVRYNVVDTLRYMFFFPNAIMAKQTYMSFGDVFVICWHVVPIHTCLCLELLPPHTEDAGQHHGFSQDCVCRRRDVDTHWLARVDWGSREMFYTFSAGDKFKSPHPLKKLVWLIIPSPGCLAFTV